MDESEDKKPATKEPSPQQETGNLKACLESYYLSSKFTDMTIVTAEKEFKVHKLLVCSQSGFFARMFDGNWLETSTNTVKLMDDDPSFVQVMIDFMSGCDYDSSENGHFPSILFHLGAYQIAEKYNVPSLKKHAQSQFEYIVKIGWVMDDFPRAIAETYAATPANDRGLRDLIVRTASLHFSDLLEKESFVKVLESTPGFSADMAKHIFREARINNSWKYINHLGHEAYLEAETENTGSWGAQTGW